METKVAKAHAKYIRIAPRKVKIVCDLIRGKDIKTAKALLMQSPKAASEVIIKLLNSAVANAENNHEMDPDSLYVSETYANPGPILKRIRPVARGRAHRINKRTSHITVVVAERSSGVKK
jgi:large subunit ribosomal protein L22